MGEQKLPSRQHLFYHSPACMAEAGSRSEKAPWRRAVCRAVRRAGRASAAPSTGACPEHAAEASGRFSERCSVRLGLSERGRVQANRLMSSWQLR